MKPTTTRKNARRGAKSDKADDPKYLARLVKEGHATDIEDAKHVVKLMAKGMLSLGKPGPIPPELLRPGPRGPNARRAVRWMKRGR